MKSTMLTITILIGFFLAGCNNKNSNKYFIHSEVIHFEVSGNGQELIFPVFPQTIDIENLSRNVEIAEYYHNKLSELYNFKEFNYINSLVTDRFIEKQGVIGIPQPCYMFDQDEYKLEVFFTGYNHGQGRYLFRLTNELTPGFKNSWDHTVDITSGNSASIVALFDEVNNRGQLVVISMLTKEITPDLTPEEFAEFLSMKNSFGGITAQIGFTKSDQAWMDQVFGEGTYPLPMEQPPTPPTAKVTFVPYDTPPKPIGGYKAIAEQIIYPEEAKNDSLEGAVVLQAFINEKGQPSDIAVLKGVREDLNQAAVNAIKSVKFKPALQENTPVGVWISIPINFRLQ